MTWSEYLKVLLAKADMHGISLRSGKLHRTSTGAWAGSYNARFGRRTSSGADTGESPAEALARALFEVLTRFGADPPPPPE